MSTTAEPLLSASRPSRYDRWAARMRGSGQRRRLVRALAPILVTLLAAALRLWNLGHPHEIVFDETYYVKDAWSQWNLGFPANWPDNANALFAAGQTDVFLPTGSFIVHPPLGKWLIGLGMWVVGPGSSVGWRISAAVFGTATVLLVYLVARTLTRSTAVATVAGLLMAVDGLAIVLSRVSLLDVFLTFFLVLAFWFVLLDRERTLDRLADALTTDADDPPRLGPVLWQRPWLVAAGAAAGGATAVKWSGLYVLAALGIYAVVTDALARRRAGATRWSLGALRQAPVTALALLPAAFVVYLASWTGWLVTSGGYDRHAADADPATGFWSWVPLPLQSLWRYHEAMYAFHVGLTTPHSYASPAWQWPLLVRPTSMYWHQDKLGEAGCQAASSCVQAISSIPNPLIWWAGVAAAVWLVWRLIARRDATSAFVLVGLAATYLPWLLYPERTIFQFYTVAMLPFLVIALALALRDVAGSTHASPARRTAGQRVVWIFLVVVLAVSAFWYPVWTGMTVPYDFWRLHNWLPTWI